MRRRLAGSVLRVARLWPRSLLARTFSLLAGLLILASAGSGIAYRTYQIEPRSESTASFIASAVTLSRSALMSAQPTLLRDLLRELSEYEGVRIYVADPTERLQAVPETAYLRRLIERVRGQLGEETRFAFERNDVAGFFVSFAIDEDQFWATFPIEKINPAPSIQWVFWGIAALALILLGVYAIVFRVRGPLAALTGAARQIGQGLQPPALDEKGPEELRQVAIAFNQMMRDLARLEEDRALVLAGVSHDLRTPLTRLRLSIEMMGASDQARDEMVSDIEEMNAIVGQFLDFARALSGEQAQEVAVSSIANELLALYQLRTQDLHADIEPTPAQSLRPIAIRRMMANLIDNARRHGGGDVTLTVRPLTECVRIEVLDRGPGIPGDQIERLKRPFQRLESARSNVGGSGLGLAIVERVARVHGARLDLLAREGGGLIARVDLPFSSDLIAQAGR